MKQSLREHLISGLGGLFGLTAILFGLLFMNGLEDLKQKKSTGTATRFSVKPPSKKKVTKIVKRNKPKQRKKARPKIAPPNLGTTLNGSSFGLDQFEFLSEAGAGLLNNTSNVVMTEDTVDQVPRPRYRPSLEYPPSARKKSIEGYVTLNLLVGTKGEVEKIKLLASEPQGVFDQVAMSNAREWQFDPANYKGKQVKVWVRQKISFRLN
jgi:protein TonB